MSAPRLTPVERAFRAPARDLAERAQRTRLAGLELGVWNLEAAARAALATGSASPGEKARAASRLAPDLPSAQMALARASWRERDFATAARATAAALAALNRDLEASLWLRAAAWAVLCATLVGGALAFIGLSGVGVARRAIHDVGDWVSTEMPEFARAALLGLAVIAPLLLGEGVLGVALVVLGLGLLFGGRSDRIALTIAAGLLLLGTFHVAGLVATSLHALEADPGVLAVAAAESGNASPLEIARLERAERFEPYAAAALALRARRMGRLEEADARYRALLRARPGDSVLSNNAANVSLALGDSKRAIRLYNDAASALDSAVVYYNLSQAYGHAIQLDQQDRALSRAQAMDLDVVNELSDLHSLLGKTFVADLPTPVGELRARTLAASGERGMRSSLVERWAPGRLGREAVFGAAAFGAVVFSAILLGARLAPSRTCGRCGRRICPRCDGPSPPGAMCAACTRLTKRPETTDPALRMARVTELRHREQRRARLALGVSLLVPGSAGVLAQRPFLGLAGVLFFSAGASCLIGSVGAILDPFALGGAGRVAGALGASLFGALYLAQLVAALRHARGA
jgi:tetratricopeptide (TPR) repeat protein